MKKVRKILRDIDLTPIKKALKKLWYRFLLLFNLKKRKRHHIKDTQICEVIKKESTLIDAGYRVITVRGYGTIISIRQKNWLKIGLGKGGYGPVEHTADSVHQYFVKFKTIRGNYKTYPLNFADYNYMDQTKKIQVAEIYISGNGFAQLTEECKDSLSYMPYFNSNSRGKDIFKRLTDNDYSIVKSKK